jgi:hypothetical protein
VLLIVEPMLDRDSAARLLVNDVLSTIRSCYNCNVILHVRLVIQRAAAGTHKPGLKYSCLCVTSPQRIPRRPLRSDIYKNWNDTEKISMAPAQG